MSGYDKYMHHFLQHFFVPRHSNNHHAKALHLDSLLCYVLLFAVFNLGIRIIHKDYPTVLGYATDIRVDTLLSDTNARRIASGLVPLTLNVTLSQAAAAKAQDMFSHNYWAHNSPQGKTPWDFISASGYQYTIAGENLAKNFSTSDGVVDAWMASPTHRDNIMKSGYRDIGFAIMNGTLNGEETTLVVQMFGTTNVAASAPTEVKPIVIQPEAASEVAPVEVKQLGEQTSQPAVNVTPSTVTVAGSADNSLNTFLTSAFSNVSSQPLFNIPTLTRKVAFLFIGIIIAILIVDELVISKKRITRIAGHNVAHILFFTALLIALTIVRRGTLL